MRRIVRHLPGARLAATAAAIWIATAACADGGPADPRLQSGSAPETTTAAVASLRLSPTVLSVPVGDTVRIGATARDRYGRVMRVDVSWESSDSTIAVVEDGLVIPLRAGAVKVTARAGTLAATAGVGVPTTTATLHRIAIAPETLALKPGGQAALRVQLVYTTDTSLWTIATALRKAAQWTSANPGVATVAGGIVTAVAPGQTEIRVTFARTTAAGMVQVTDTATATPAPTVPSLFRSYHVTPNGTAAGDGSTLRPWSLARALAQPPGLSAGDTIWLHGGTYAGNVISQLNGTAQAPIVVRQAPGERATIDGRLQIEGSYATYWGFEVMSSSPNRVSAIAGSDAPDLPRSTMIVAVFGRYIKLIHLVTHDLGGGIFANQNAVGLEIYGNLLYNNGWRAPDGGKGHNLYLQNATPTMVVMDNVAFGSFAVGLHMYGTDDATLRYFQIEGNTFFESGLPVADYPGNPGWNVLMYGGGDKFGSTVYRGNSLYHSDGAHETLKLGNAGDPPGADIEFRENIVQGRSAFNEVRRYTIVDNRFTSGRTPLSGQDVLIGLRLIAGDALANNVWDRNRYALAPGGDQLPFTITSPFEGSYLFAQWRSATGYDASTTASMTDRFTGATVIVRPSKYEPGRALVTCWNWDRAAAVNVDLSGVLQPGDRYVIHHVYNVFGAPVASGTYAGGTVSVPQPSIAPPVPIGYRAYGSPTPDFAVFIVRKL